jgi:RNA polymerase sigma factor (TIGR02999 family)
MGGLPNPLNREGERPREPKPLRHAEEIRAREDARPPIKGPGQPAQTAAAPEPVTVILEAVGAGDAQAAEQLLPLVYDELRRLAAAKMAKEAPGHTLQPTALVHEAWLKLAGSENQHWNSRGHFFSAAAEAMRRILIDRARRRQRERHGHGLKRIDLDQVDVAVTTDDELLICVDRALERLATEAPEKAAVVKLRYFAGLSIPATAEALGISVATANRHWAYARAWLFAELKRSV